MKKKYFQFHIINPYNYPYYLSICFINLAQNKIDKEKYYEIIQTQVINAIKWCNKYNIEINKNSIYYKKNVV